MSPTQAQKWSGGFGSEKRAIMNDGCKHGNVHEGRQDAQRFHLDVLRGKKSEEWQ
jgi:hypothetical protein